MITIIFCHHENMNTECSNKTADMDANAFMHFGIISVFLWFEYVQFFKALQASGVQRSCINPYRQAAQNIGAPDDEICFLSSRIDGKAGR